MVSDRLPLHPLPLSWVPADDRGRSGREAAGVFAGAAAFKTDLLQRHILGASGQDGQGAHRWVEGKKLL